MTRRSIVIASTLISMPFVLKMILDHSLWVNDAYAYALEAINVWRFSRSLLSLWEAYMSVSPKPPLIAWTAWPIVCLVGVTERIAPCLLFLNSVSIFLSIFLLLAIIDKRHGSITALTSVITLMSAPIFANYGTQFLIQVHQVLMVVFFLFTWENLASTSWIKSLCFLTLGVVLSSLTMVSSPVYVIFPGFAIVVGLIKKIRGSQNTQVPVALVVVSLLSLVLSVVWYSGNFQRVFEYANIAVNWRWVGVNHEGLAESFWTLLLSLVRLNGPLLPTLLVVIVLYFSTKQQEGRFIHSLETISIGQIAFVLIVFSLSQNHEPRYLLPLTPYLVVLVSSFMNRLRKATQAVLLIVVFVVFIGEQVLAFANLSYGPKEDYKRVKEVAEAIHEEAATKVLISSGSLTPAYRDQVGFMMFEEFGELGFDHPDVRSLEFIIMEELAKKGNETLKDDIVTSSLRCMRLVDRFQPALLILASDSTLVAEVNRLENIGFQLAEVTKNQLYIHKRIKQTNLFSYVRSIGLHNELIVYKRKPDGVENATSSSN